MASIHSFGQKLERAADWNTVSRSYHAPMCVSHFRTNEIGCCSLVPSYNQICLQNQSSPAGHKSHNVNLARPTLKQHSCTQPLPLWVLSTASALFANSDLLCLTLAWPINPLWIRTTGLALTALYVLLLLLLLINVFFHLNFGVLLVSRFPDNMIL